MGKSELSVKPDETLRKEGGERREQKPGEAPAGMVT